MLAVIMLMISTAPRDPWTTIHQYGYYTHPYQEDISLTIPLFPEIAANLTHQVYGFLPHWRGDHTEGLRLDLISRLAWFGVELDSSGQVAESNGWPWSWTDLKDAVQASGTSFDLTVTCFDWSGDKIHHLLSNPEYRNQAIASILFESEGCDGVNIDFERPRIADRDLFSEFVAELADSLHERGQTLSVDVTAINWGERFDPAKLVAAADYIFIMGYDFHWNGSSVSGPVAPLEGETYNVTRSVDYYIEETDVVPERIILGIPYYGYDWPTQDTLAYSETQASGFARIYSSAIDRLGYNTLQWHSETSSPWFHYNEGGQTRQCWFEDTVSLALKYDLAKDRNLAGIGIWALTYDAGRDELWDILVRKFTTGITEYPIERETRIQTLPSIMPIRKLKRFLKENPDLVLFDVNGRKIRKPNQGVIFIKTPGGITKVVVTR